MKINKVIFYTIFETILLTLIIFITYFVWDSFDQNTREIALSYTNLEKSLSLELEDNLKPLTKSHKNIIDENNSLRIKINNNSKIKKQYYLYLKINETTDLETKYLKVSLGEEQKYLLNLENFTQDNSKYYLLKKGIIDKKDNITEYLNIWLSEETPNSEQNKTLNFEINVEEM